MAIRHVLIDDLDGSTEGVHTVTFALGSAFYAIDLSTANHDRLAAALAPYITAGRRLPKPGTARGGAERRGPVTGRQIRAWWQENAERLGLPPVRDNGTIPNQVRDAYRRRTTTASAE